MKVQCSCGAKSVFEITEEMQHHPVRFTCPACGLDSSEFVDGLIRQTLGQNATPPGRVIIIYATQEGIAAPSSNAAIPQSNLASTTGPGEAPRIRINRPVQPPSPASISSQDGPEDKEPEGHRRCARHPREVALEKCYVCSKPICPSCMELFGYVCSPLCKARAASHGIEVPEYAGQKSVSERRVWRRTAWAAGSLGIVLVTMLGFWIWYSWFGSIPKVVFSVRFPEPAYSGQTAWVGPDQLIYLRGGMLVRHDLQQKKQVWSHDLIDKTEIKTETTRQLEQAKSVISKANAEAWENMPKMPDPEKLSKDLERDTAAALELWVRKKNIWILSSQKLTRYDWESGKIAQTINLPPGYGGLINRGDELLALTEESGRPAITSINLTTCDTRTADVAPQKSAKIESPKENSTARRDDRKTARAGLPIGMPGRDAGKVMDPRKVAAQAQNLSLPNRIALPAILANSWNQERALNELEDAHSKPQSSVAATGAEHFNLVPTKEGVFEFSSRLVERKIITHSTLSPRPAKSVLDGPVNVTQSTEVANEMLNEMQRERGGGVVEEDVSRYAVTIRNAGTADSWTGEITGHPAFLALQTVNVIAANKSVIVFNKTTKKLWQAALNFNFSKELSIPDHLSAPYGQGPCVEFKDLLLVFDAGVLTAFELKTGNVRWRLPSVGITGLFFDEQGMIYVNTTTGSPDEIKFSHQINIAKKVVSAVLKVSPSNGKIIWSAQPGGLVNYVGGKFVYTVQSFAPEEEEDNPYRQETGFEALPYTRIKRLNPKNGHAMWEHFQQRSPLDVQFDRNYIRLVFKKEVQVLKCMAW